MGEELQAWVSAQLVDMCVRLTPRLCCCA